MAQYEDLELDQGSDAKWEVKLLQTDGTPRNLTGYSVQGMVNRSYGADSSEAIAFTTRIAPSNAIAGILEFRLTHDQTDLMKRRRYVYDLELTYIDSDAIGVPTIKERILEGNLIVSRSVTKFD